MQMGITLPPMAIVNPPDNGVHQTFQKEEGTENSDDGNRALSTRPIKSGMAENSTIN